MPTNLSTDMSIKVYDQNIDNRLSKTRSVKSNWQLDSSNAVLLSTTPIATAIEESIQKKEKLIGKKLPVKETLEMFASPEKLDIVS